MNKNEFGNFLAKLRNENKLTQEQLGEKLNVGSKTISKWECGISSPDLNTLCELAKIYNLSLLFPLLYLSLIFLIAYSCSGINLIF